jgi:hypothetical protein
MTIAIPILFVAGMLAVVGTIAYVSYRAEKKRTEELKQVAADLGFDFAPEGDAVFLQRLSNFHLFAQGHSKKLWNLLRGTSDNLEVAVFDYRYVTGGGKHSHTWKHSVICFQFEGRGVPAFALRPENVFHKIGSWLGYQDIDFDSHPVFSKSYLLRGEDEDAIRKLFTTAVLEYYESQPGLSAEGSGNTLLHYRHAARVEPNAIRSFMEDGFRVLALYRSGD